MAAAPSATRRRSWSIYDRSEITSRYEILDRIGSGAYSDVYRGRRRIDGLPVALKEVHDYQSSFREIEALQALRGEPNVVELVEYFWQEDEDAVLVLEFLQTDLTTVIREGRRRDGGIGIGEVKRWMVQILSGVDACHRIGIVHRDLKPSNFLIDADGVLKLADFGQSRMLNVYDQVPANEAWTSHPLAIDHEGYENQATQEHRSLNEEDYLQQLDGFKNSIGMDDADKDINQQDGEASCLATCSNGDIEDDMLKDSYSYELHEGGEANDSGLTSCVGTRWFMAPELLYGSASYGLEIDLWSLGCVFAELLSLKTLFPGTSDIEQLGMIISVLGNLTEESYPGCSMLPNYIKLSYNEVRNPIGLEAHLMNRSASEINIVKRLVCYNPASRATASELLHDAYFSEEPLPVPLSELKVPSLKDLYDESSPGGYGDMESDSDLDDFSHMDISTTEKGFSIRFS